MVENTSDGLPDMPTSKPTSKPRLRVQATGKKTTMDRLMSKLRASSPKKDGISGTYEVSRSSQGILSRVRFVLKTGLASFDRKTGGFPFGRITEVYGLEACGKTALVMQAASKAQQKYIFEIDEKTQKQTAIDDKTDVTVLFIDNEQSLTEGEKQIVDGVSLDVLIARCDTVDQLFKIIDLSIDELELVESDLKKAGTPRTQLLVVIIDTIAGTSSAEELKAKWDKVDYSRQPKQLREGFRTLMRRINRRNVCVIATNQVSDSFKPKAYSPGNRPANPQDEDFSTFGGKALKFYARLRVFMFQTAKLKLVKKTRFPAGFVSGFVTSKNSQLSPLREGRIVLLYKGGLSNVFSLLEDLTMFKHIAERNSEGEITFKFERAGIVPTTFDKTKASASELEDEEVIETRGGKVKKAYKIADKYEWPAYYEAHRADIDLLHDVAIKFTFDIPGIEGFAEAESGDDEDSEDDDLGEDDLEA